MTEAAKQKRRQYINAWRRRNKIKVANYNCLYWTKKAEELEADMKKEADKDQLTLQLR